MKLFWMLLVGILAVLLPHQNAVVHGYTCGRGKYKRDFIIEEQIAQSFIYKQRMTYKPPSLLCKLTLFLF